MEAGQPLVLLDPTFSKADVQDIEEQLFSLTEQSKRLSCELEPGALLDPNLDCGLAQGSLQERICAKRRNEYTSRLETEVGPFCWTTQRQN